MSSIIRAQEGRGPTKRRCGSDQCPRQCVLHIFTLLLKLSHMAAFLSLSEEYCNLTIAGVIKQATLISWAKHVTKIYMFRAYRVCVAKRKKHKKQRESKRTGGEKSRVVLHCLAKTHTQNWTTPPPKKKGSCLLWSQEIAGSHDISSPPLFQFVRKMFPFCNTSPIKSSCFQREFH